MSERKVKQSLDNLNNALCRLKEATKTPNPDQLQIDGTIQRFEFVIELFWKTIKRILEDGGIQVTTPKEALKEAFKMGWIVHEVRWLEMLKDRNLTSHIYDEKLANEIFQRIKNNFEELNSVYQKLSAHCNNKRL